MFKKILSTVLLLAVIFTVFSMAFVPCSAATVTDGEKFYTLGDANDDGLTDIRDLVRIKRYTADTTTTIAEVAADLDADGKVDATDLAAYRRGILVDNLDFATGGANWSGVY